MSYYGYITSKEFKPVKGDVLWDFTRIDKEGNEILFNGLETLRDVTQDKYCIIFASKMDFILWKDEYNKQ